MFDNEENHVHHEYILFGHYVRSSILLQICETDSLLEAIMYRTVMSRRPVLPPSSNLVLRGGLGKVLKSLAALELSVLDDT